MSRININESEFRKLCEQGYTVPQISEKITQSTGVLFTAQRVREAAKFFGISLRSKPRSVFNFVKDNNTIENNTSNNEQTVVAAQPEIAVVEELGVNL